MHEHRTALARALLVGLLAVTVVTGCRSDHQVSPASDPPSYEQTSPQPEPAPEPEPEPAPEPAPAPGNDCAYEGDPACGPYPDDPVPGVCTPDYPGDIACRSNEDLLNDTAEINRDRINNGW
jgi:hypothetical protein